MKIIYKNLTVDEAFELVKEDDKRQDLYFEKRDRKNPPSELTNINHYELAAVDFSKQVWFQRKVEDDAECHSEQQI